MNFRLRQYLSLFLLSVFLYAYTEKGIHDIIHADDVHCNAHNEKHFHNQEHHCAICDFEFPWFDKSAKPVHVSVLRQYTELSFVSPVTTVSVKETTTRSPRAPPVLA